MTSLNIQISDKAVAFAATEAEKRGLPNAAAFAAKLLEETANAHHASEPSVQFYASKTDLNDLFALQRVTAIRDLNDLTADFWPENETADDFIRTIDEVGGAASSGATGP